MSQIIDTIGLRFSLMSLLIGQTDKTFSFAYFHQLNVKSIMFIQNITNNTCIKLAETLESFH